MIKFLGLRSEWVKSFAELYTNVTIPWEHSHANLSPKFWIQASQLLDESFISTELSIIHDLFTQSVNHRLHEEEKSVIEMIWSVSLVIACPRFQSVGTMR